MIIKKRPQCAAIVQPGEYLIPLWDNKQCAETMLHLLIKCEECGQDYCLATHWRTHTYECPELYVPPTDLRRPL